MKLTLFDPVRTVKMPIFLPKGSYLSNLMDINHIINLNTVVSKTVLIMSDQNTGLELFDSYSN